MSDKPTTSFRLPDGKQIDVHLVKLAGGRIVARTRDELERVQPTPSPATASDPRR
jgi:urease beta subunit